MLNWWMVAPSRCRLRGIRVCFTPRRSSGTTGKSAAAGSVLAGPMLTKISALKDFFLGSQLLAELATRSAEPANHSLQLTGRPLRDRLRQPGTMCVVSAGARCRSAAELNR